MDVMHAAYMGGSRPSEAGRAPGEDSAYLSQGQGVISTILAAQSTDVDTISGATFSSTGIINAVNDALGKAENQ